VPTTELYIGLMSGTSADSIDAVLVDLSEASPNLFASHTEPIDDLRDEIHALAEPGEDEISRLGRLDQHLGLRFAAAVTTLLRKTNCPAEQVCAIGSHGQTIRHCPDGNDGEPAFTLQIGDPSSIAHQTGIDVVADFRRRDIAAGGQGAPLAPAFHLAYFETVNQATAVVNIGGMANVTLLPGDGSASGYDTGPGNVLMDGWAQRHLGQPYDKDGTWAASGHVNHNLLELLLSHTYFSSKPPKSTGREEFNVRWLDNTLAQLQADITPSDIQATLLELTAISIADELRPFSPQEIHICGGGAFNTSLMERLCQLLDPVPVTSTSQRGIDPEWVEAIAFAWLAQQTLQGKPGNLPSVTGAERSVVLGGVYPA